ncbi:MAG: hypothetical protein ACLRS8_16235 [Parabacteroides merdae]
MNRLVIALIGSSLVFRHRVWPETDLFYAIILLFTGMSPTTSVPEDQAMPIMLQRGLPPAGLPAYPVFLHQEDLVDWKQTGRTCSRQQPEWTKSSFWAPE